MPVAQYVALAAKPILLFKKHGPELFFAIGLLLWMHLFIPLWFPRLLPGLVRLFSHPYTKLTDFVAHCFNDSSDTPVESRLVAEVQRLDQAIAAIAHSTALVESRISRLELASVRNFNRVAAADDATSYSRASVLPTPAAPAPAATIAVAASSSLAVNTLPFPDAPVAPPDNNADDDGGNNSTVIQPTPLAAERALALLSRSHQLYGTRYFSNDGFVSIQAFLDEHPSTLNGNRMRFAGRLVPPMARYRTYYLKINLQVRVDTCIRMIVHHEAPVDWDELHRAMGTETCYLVDNVVQTRIGALLPWVKFDRHSSLRVIPSSSGCCLERIFEFYDKMDADYYVDN